MPPPTIDDMLAAARARLTRLAPVDALAAQTAGAALLDIRNERQVRADGTIPGALHIERNVFEWRLDPASAHRHPNAPAREDQVVVICDEGYQSSLAAAALQDLGFTRATDLDGGFQAWRAAGLPVTAPRR